MTYTQVWDYRTSQISATLIQRDSDGAFIPFDENNADYRAYQDWLAAGNLPTPISAPPNVTPVTPPPPPEPEPAPPPTTSGGSAPPYRLPDPP